jgi:hypothetical protein
MKHFLIASFFLFVFLGGVCAQTAPGYVVGIEEFNGNQYLVACEDPDGLRCQVYKVCGKGDWRTGLWYIFPRRAVPMFR